MHSSEKIILNKITVVEEAARCLLCHEAPCTEACTSGEDPARMIRALRFDNLKGAAARVRACDCEANETAVAAQGKCEAACIRTDSPVRIGAIKRYLSENVKSPEALPEVDLSIEFCGVRCENPFFLSSSIVASNYEMCAKALEMGWAGVVFKTIGVLRPKEVSPRFDTIGKEGTPFIGFRNLEQIAEHPLEENLMWMKQLKADYPNKILVASIMGQTDEEWTYLARAVTEIGADIIECNFSCPHMSGENLGSDVGQNPELVKHYTECVRRGTNLPILAKMTPNLGNMEIPAVAAVEGGADGIAAINTIKSITGIDLSGLAATPAVDGKSAVSGYSGKAVKPIALRFIHDMAVHKKLAGIPLSGMGGIETWRDALEFILMGCANIQITTAVMQYGYRIIDDLIEGFSFFMAENGYKSVDELVGKALPQMVPAELLNRDTIVYPVLNRDKCVGCGRCYISCYDAGHQAIIWEGDKRKPALSGKKCAGCHLCLHVCPNGAITPGKRINKPIVDKSIAGVL